MRQIKIDGVTYNIIKINSYVFVGHLRKSIYMQRPKSRGTMYNVIQYTDGTYSPVVSLPK